MATAPASLTERQRVVLDAIGSRDAVSHEYVARTAGQSIDQPTNPILGLIVLGLVERCFGSTMLRLTHAGRETLAGPPDTRKGWTVDGSAYRRAGVLGEQTYGAHVQLEQTRAPDPGRPWRAYCVVEVNSRKGWTYPPVVRLSWHPSAPAGLDALDAFIDGLAHP